MGNAVLLKRGRGRPRKDEHRPNCPQHPGSTIRLDGYHRSWSRFHQRPRYRCVTQPGTRGHLLSLPRPVRHPTDDHPHSGEACPHCESVYERHEGNRTGRAFLFAITEIAETLMHVGNGGSLRRASAARREDIFRVAQKQWTNIGPGETSKQGNLAAGYVDHYAPVILDRLAPRKWPRIIAIDSMPLRTRGYRQGKYVGDLPAGEIMVAIDHTVRPGVPCLIAVQGSRDAHSWQNFFSMLDGAPEWIVADLDKAIAKAVRERWPEAILFRSRDHLARLMEDYAVLDGVPRQVRIKHRVEVPRERRALWTLDKPIQEFEPHPLINQLRFAQSSPVEWAKFKAMVDEYIPHDRLELRSWLATNEPLIEVQMLLAADHPGKPVVGSGNVEGTIREHIGTSIKPRAGRYTNAARLNKILGLMMLRLRGEARRGHYVGILREYFAALGQRSGVANWRAHQDPDADRSLPRMVQEAAERQATEEARERRRRAARSRYQRVRDEEERRQREGLPSLFRGTRGPRQRPKYRRVRGKMVSDLPDLMREWDFSLNWGTDPTTMRATDNSSVFWRCHHDDDHVWEATIRGRATKLAGCPYCFGVRVHPKGSLAAFHPRLAHEWHPTKNGELVPEQVAPVSGRRVWWRCAAGHEWQAHVFSRSQGMHDCKECADQRQRKAKSRGYRTKGSGSPKRKRRPNPEVPTLEVPDDELF